MSATSSFDVRSIKLYPRDSGAGNSDDERDDIIDIGLVPEISAIKRKEDKFYQQHLPVDDGIFDGTVNEKILREGLGTFSSNNGERYHSGQWKNDKPHGYGYRFDKYGSVIYYGEFDDKILQEGYGKLKLDDGYLYEGKMKDDKFHGLGSLTIQIKDLPDMNQPNARKECLRMIADWKEGKTEKRLIYLNEIEQYYQYQFEHFSCSLKSYVLLYRENYKKQRDCLQTLLDLYEASDSDLDLLTRISKEEKLPSEMKLSSVFLLQLDSSHTALGEYTNLDSKKTYRDCLQNVWQKELRSYGRRLVWSEDEKFRDRISLKEIFEQDVNSLLAKSDVSVLQQILFLNPSVIQLFRNLVHFANDKLNQISLKYRADFVRFHKRFIQALWKDYFQTQRFDEKNEKRCQLYSDCYANILELSFVSPMNIQVELKRDKKSTSIEVQLNEKKSVPKTYEYDNKEIYVFVFDQIDQIQKSVKAFGFSSDFNTFIKDEINPTEIFLLIISFEASQHLTKEFQESLKQLGSTQIDQVKKDTAWVFMKRKNSAEKYETTVNGKDSLVMQGNFQLSINDDPIDQNSEVESVIYPVMTFALEHLKPWDNFNSTHWSSYLKKTIHREASIKEIGDHLEVSIKEIGDNLLKKLLKCGKNRLLRCFQENQSLSKDFESVIDFYRDNLVKDPNLNYQSKTNEIKRIFIYFIQISLKANSGFKNLIPTQLESIKAFMNGKQTIVELIDHFLDFNAEFPQLLQTFDKHFSIQIHEQFHQLCKEILSLLTEIFQMNLFSQKTVQTNPDEILKKYECGDLAHALRNAVSQGDIVDTKAILELDVDVNGKDPESGETALHWAVKRKNEDLILLLLEGGANIHIKNLNLQSPSDYVTDKWIDLASLLDQNPFENRLYALQKMINLLTSLGSLDFTWYVEGKQITTGDLHAFEEIKGKTFYRVLDVPKAKTKVKEPSPHYVLQAIRELLSLIKNARIVHLATPTRMIRLRGELIMSIEKSLKYFHDQINYNSLEQFGKYCVSAFEDVIKNNQSHQSFSQKLEKLEFYFLYNRKLKEITVDQALDLFEQKNGSLEGKNEIKHAFNDYEKCFQKYLFDLNPNDDSIDKITTKTREKAKQLPFDRKSIPEILAGLAIVLSLTNSDFLEKSNGKYHLKEGFNKQYLLQPHCIQILGVLMILDINGQTVSIPPNHFAEILTGQGKSWALALLAGYFILNGYQVTVACYNDYLSRRDEKDFQKNFDAFQFSSEVEYKTFQSMCEKKLYYKGLDLRSVISNIISDKDLPSLKSKEDKQSDRSILLIDEVDIFFSKYSGETFGVVGTVKNVNIEKIQKEIWQQIIAENNRDQTKLYDFIIDQFSKEINDDQMLSRLKKLNVLKSHIEKMIQTAIRIYKDMTEENLLKEQYKLDGGYIYLKNNDGKYDKNRIVAYETSFYYLKLIYEKDNSFDNAKSDGNNFGYLYISYGLISYSELPNSYDGIFGVSGSLRDLSEREQSLLEYFHVNRKSYYPSFFGDSKLKFNTNTDFVIEEGKNDWFNSIVTSAKDKIAKHRSVLIFFANETLLDEFYNSHSGDLGVTPYFATLNKIFDGKEEKNYNDLDLNKFDLDLNKLITDQHAGHHGKVSLFTKDFGRGVDFQTETSVNETGGIHVIQTFFSTDIKEEIQIKGRTARKDESGSYQLIVCLEHLQKPVTKDATYEELDSQRKIKIDSLCRKKLDQIKTNEAVHKKTLEFLKKASTQCNNNNREEYIKDIHEGIQN